MRDQVTPGTSAPGMPAAEHVDVLVLGAGISGIGAGHHLRTQCPKRSFVIVDEQDGYGGTWWTHRYPGVRSDSELYTFGYRFKPWSGPPIATGAEILDYLGEVVREDELEPRMRLRHRVLSANWCSERARWTVEGRRTDTGEPFRYTASFLWMGQGYYRHDQGYTPTWPGMEDFRGPVIHPQQWPDDLDLTGKRVVLIGSGATAATVLPALAGQCEHITMLQRSPTYFVTKRNVNELADLLRELDIPAEWTHEIVRRKVLKEQREVIRRSFEEPDALRRELLAGVRQHLGSDELVEKHFTPSYRPWQQRIAFVPDADLFGAIRTGQASVVTDTIERFEPDGIRLASGEFLPADVVISATGLNLSVMGDIAFAVDGGPVDFSRTVGYLGAMFTDVPNLIWVFGYFRASWTLRVDLLADFMCRLLAHMDEIGASQVMPQLRPEDGDMTLLPWVDAANFNPGYLMRILDRLPRQSSRAPWRHTQDYWEDQRELASAALDDGTLVYGMPPQPLRRTA
ncbi:NAD(P)/FAD-dependent oxidoreductase [Verticiella sediminum]|uniref:NAD(P)/FAD-dependent oxidoreductase n=1 Tax=Verticiella sediminum TaxID=1247510 RepID=A0A556AIY7_9BURK|nr:NAD(P)/FAD-dependent oxidoreductase [Verticiella sediminum]TSH92830.1 NAD(P)/FAD-dependent oxidoreductase [Verticiella sediminum]